MERGDRHGPRIDDELARETEPLERGAPVEPRVEELSELARSISPSVFPADRDTLLDSAVHNHATQPVLDRLARLPAGRTFENPEAVWRALGGGTERRG